MKISFINESLPEYGAYETTMHYYREADKRGFKVFYNVFSPDIDFYVIGMTSSYENLKKFLKPNKFIYIEHSIECVLPEKSFFRDWIIPNSLMNFFFSPRHLENVLCRLSPKYINIINQKHDFLVVPVDYNLFNIQSDIKRISNLRLFVGLLHPNKGIYAVIEEAKKLTNTKFLFIGKEDPNFNIKKLKYDNTIYLGHIEKQKLPFFYNKSSHFYLLPTNGQVESAGRVLWEGILCGCIPIINKDVGNTSYSWYSIDRKKIIEQMNLSIENLFNYII